MKDENKTKEQLMDELVELTRRVSGLEGSAARASRIEKQLSREYSDSELRFQEKTIELAKTNEVLQTDITECRQDIIESLHANCYAIKPVDPGRFMAVIKSIVNFWSSVVKLPSGD